MKSSNTGKPEKQTVIWPRQSISEKVKSLKANPIILYSSIGSLHSRPDLTERTIVLELQRIPAEKCLKDIDI